MIFFLRIRLNQVGHFPPRNQRKKAIRLFGRVNVKTMNEQDRVEEKDFTERTST